MTYIVSSGALNSTPTPTPVVVMTTAGHVTRQPIAVSDHGLVNWQLTGRRVEPDLKRLGFETNLRIYSVRVRVTVNSSIPTTTRMSPTKSTRIRWAISTWPSLSSSLSNVCSRSSPSVHGYTIRSLLCAFYGYFQARRQEMKWVCACFFVKKWTFPQRRVHYFFWGGGAYAPNAPPAYGPGFSPSDCCEAAGGLVFCCCFLFSYHIIDSCQTIYLNIYRTLRQIFRICIELCL